MIEGAPIGMSFTFHDMYYRSHDSTYGKVSNSLKRAGRVSEADEQALLAEFAALEARPEVDFQYLAVRLCARKP